MRHKVHSHSFNRKGSARKSLIQGLVASVILNERVRTTLAKAKELRRHVDRAITLSKKGDLATRRLLISRIRNQSAVEKLLSDVGVRFKKRPGGYTRILKLSSRPGDMAPMAYIELVDYKLPDTAKDGEATVRGDKDAVKRAKVRAKVATRQRKTLRQLQAQARKVARA